MPDRPLLILPRSEPLRRQPRRGAGGSHLRTPQRSDQGTVIGPALDSLIDAFVAATPAGTSSENILVLETVGRPENFHIAVAAVPGLTWLAEVDVDGIEADPRFYERPRIGIRFFKERVFGLDARDSREIVSALTEEGIIGADNYLVEDITPDAIRAAIPEDFVDHAEEILAAIEDEKKATLPGRMYLSLSNRQALSEIKSLFDSWERGGRLRHGAGAWGDIFSHLRSVRFWDVEDRVRDTGIIDYWQKEVECKKGTSSTVVFEIEFSYNDNPNPVYRRRRQQEVEALVAAEGGTVIASCDIPDIHFQAIKVDVPVASIERFLGRDYSALFRYGDILFFRPSPQCAFETFSDGTEESLSSGEATEEQPVVALLDGLPFSRHTLLEGFTIIDDPDDFASGYLPKEQNHGTAMLSLICHGELDAGESPIARRVYVRPILKPDDESPLPKRPERVPKNVFFEDIVERSVRNMFEGQAGEKPSAPTVKIVCLSVADPDRMFHHFPGPTARLLDWLSYKYKILFCVSAGNIKDPISLGMDLAEFSALSEDEKIPVVLKALYDERRNRRILAPSESINAITVGALHHDASSPVALDGCVDILPSGLLPSPVSPLGHGFRSSIKPEILVPGGRQLFTCDGDGEFSIPRVPMRSGQKVASAAIMPGERNRTIYTCGTSNAAALATRWASIIHDVILDVLTTHGREDDGDSVTALIKALLVHGASWGAAADIISAAILEGRDYREVPKELARCLGYGHPDFMKSVACTAVRATAIGFGAISKDQRHEYRLPLPPSLGGLDCWRRLTVTLAWLSPINLVNRKYRRASLTFEPSGIDTKIGGKRAEAQWQQVRNGTIQHEIFEGDNVVAFEEDDHLVIPIQCREDAGPLAVDVPYGLAVSLEVKEDIGIPLYEEIQSVIEVPVREPVHIS